MNTYGPYTEKALQRIQEWEQKGDVKGKLNLSNLRLTSLPPLPASLKVLYCSNTPLSTLPELPASLQELVCFKTPLTTLPELPASLKDLCCYNCPNLIIQRKQDETIQDYTKRWKVIYEILRRDEIILCCKAVKEELMIKTWHPSRVIDWCWDEEEKAEWRQYETVV